MNKPHREDNLLWSIINKKNVGQLLGQYMDIWFIKELLLITIYSQNSNICSWHVDIMYFDAWLSYLTILYIGSRKRIYKYHKLVMRYSPEKKVKKNVS